MLIRKWILLGSTILLTVIIGCNREQVAPDTQQPEPPVAEVAEDPENPALETGDDASFGVPTELPESAPPPGDPWWAEAVTSHFAAARGYEVERQRPAPNALLAFGRDAAREALEAIIADPEPRADDEVPFTHRFMAAWCLAHDYLDYTPGREIVLRYLRAMCDTEYLDPDIERKLNANEDHASAAAALYARTRDTEVLRGLLQVAPCSDGALTEGLVGVYLRIALADLDGFLAVLSECTREETAKVSWFIATSLREHGGRASDEWTQLVSQLEVTARTNDAPHHDTARDVLVHLNEQVE